MKKGVMLILSAMMLITFVALVSAVTCKPTVSLVNQDPYPAIPGEYVKVVFQIDGLENSECGKIQFGIKQDFPFSLDPNTTNEITLNSGTFQRQYGSFYTAPYKLRINEDALNGDNLIETYYSMYPYNSEVLNSFNISIQDTRAKFEVYVKDYDPLTNTLTFELLNIADADVQAVTVEIPKQDNVQVKGANRMIVGDLDSNEYTTADFEATPKDGNINLNIYYTDSINVRREINETVPFDSSYFSGRSSENKKSSWWIYVIIIGVIIWIVWSQMKKAKMKKKLREKHMMQSHEKKR